MKKIKLIVTFLACLTLLSFVIFGVFIYRFTSPSDILIDPDGVKYVDGTPTFSPKKENCLNESQWDKVHKETIVVDGYRRSYWLHIPDNVSENPPIVFAIHGSGGDGQGMRSQTAGEFEKLAGQFGFIVVYPDGFDGGWNDLREKSPHTAKRLNLDDPLFYREIITSLSGRYNADINNVFYFGLSNGGQMTLRLLLEAPELVTAAAMVGANLPTENSSGKAYSDLQSRPVMFVHGTEDKVVPFEGGDVRLFGVVNFGEVYSSEKTVSHWVKVANYKKGEYSTTKIDTEDDDTSITLNRWVKPGKPEIRFYSVVGGGHTIPMPKMPTECEGFDAVSHDMNTVVEAWEFFRSNMKN